MWRAAIMLTAWAGTAWAQVDSQGQLGLESRGFVDDDEPLTEDQAVGLFGRLEIEDEGETIKERVRLFGRLDAYDEQRSSLVVEEAWAEWKVDRFRLRAGADLLNWTATEAFHPADVINSRNLDSDLESLEKIGEPMVMASFKVGDGSLAAYYMPMFTKPRLASPNSRLSFVPGLSFGKRLVMDMDGEVSRDDFGHQAALRLSQQIGSADIAIEAVHHLDRSQPLVAFYPQTGKVHPLFQTVSHVGLTYAQAVDALLIKVEAAYRYFWRPDGGVADLGPSPSPFIPSTLEIPDRTHTEVAVGFEYGIPHESGWESTLLLEGQSYLGVGKRLRRSLSPFQNDVLVGYRLAMNDEASTEIIASVIGDVETRDQLLASVTYKQRLGEVWGLAIAGRMFLAEEPAPGAIPVGLEAWRDADHLRLSIIRYF